MRLGIFGGTFDPIHYGHLLLAEHAREKCELDEVWFVLSAQPPHKTGQSVTPAKLRLEMLELALGGYRPFVASGIELEREGLSYTSDTLAAIAAEDSSRELFILLGADAVADLPGWHAPEKILALATPIFANRAGYPAPDMEPLRPLVAEERWPAIAESVHEFPNFELSSSDIRQRVQEGRSIRFRLPRAVEAVIESSGIYKVQG